MFNKLIRYQQSPSKLLRSSAATTKENPLKNTNLIIVTTVLIFTKIIFAQDNITTTISSPSTRNIINKTPSTITILNQSETTTLSNNNINNNITSSDNNIIINNEHNFNLSTLTLINNINNDNNSKREEEDNDDTIEITIVPIVAQQNNAFNVPMSAQNSYANCANHSRLDTQPVTSECAKIKKCCPKGQNYQMINDTKPECKDSNLYFNVEVIVATFYDRCIEDTEEYLELDVQYGYPCVAGSEAFVYSQEYSDILYVIQNGSLLRIDENFESFDVFDDYCLDMDSESKIITAYVCNQTFGSMVHVSKAQSYVYAICMLTSVPCLIVTTFFYLIIPQLNDLHGKSLACHSICLGMGFFMLSISQIRGTLSQTTGYIIQYFILACFFWLAVMCIDICVHVWYYIPKKKRVSRRHNHFRFAFYGLICQGLPLILVLLSASKELPGMPSYYLKGLTEATRSSQQYFIPPISTTLFVCFALLTISFFGFRKLDPIVSKMFLYRKKIERDHLVVKLDVIDIDQYEDVRHLAKSTGYLYGVMTINWIFEIISFYVQSAEGSLVIFDIMNALQGILIFIIFVCLPRPLHIIKRWWMDRGSLDLNLETMPCETELEILNNGQTNTTENKV